MQTMITAALALGVVGSLLLAYFGCAGLYSGRMDKTKAWLMIAAATVTLLNVFVMAPVVNADRPAEHMQRPAGR